MKTFPHLVCPDPAPGANTQPIPLSLCVFRSHIPLAAYISFLLVIVRFVSFVKRYLHTSEDRGRKKKGRGSLILMFLFFYITVYVGSVAVWRGEREGKQDGILRVVCLCVCLRLCVFISV